MKSKSRFLHINPSILLEYIINDENPDIRYNGDEIGKDIFNFSNLSLYKMKTNNEILYSEDDNRGTNNTINHLAVPCDNEGLWYIGTSTYDNKNFTKYTETIKSDVDVESEIPYDTIRLHILSGYSFKDVYGIMLKVFTKNNSNENINLAQWLYRRADGNYSFERPFIINNRIYDKHIDLKIPSVKYLGNIKADDISDDMREVIGENGLNIINRRNHNIEIIFSRILFDDVEEVKNEYTSEIDGYKFMPVDNIHIELPYDSESDKFNIMLKESNSGTYLEFYTTWDDNIMTHSIVDTLNTKLRLYSNTELTEDTNEYMYNADLADEILNLQNKWMINHEIITNFYNNDGKTILPMQIYSINQTFDNASYSVKQTKFKYKPIINNEDASNLSYIVFEYTAKLINRYDGTQIVRKGALTTWNKERYIDNIKQISSNNIQSYRVYNKLNEVNAQINNRTNVPVNKFTKIFYNSSEINVNNINDYVQVINLYGDRILLQLNKSGAPLNLSDIATYTLLFNDVNNNKVEINATYSDLMNLYNGELEFNLTPNHTDLMRNAKDKKFAIRCNNLDGTSSTIIEIKYKMKE